MVLLVATLSAGVASAAWESVGPDGGNIVAMALDPHHAGRVFAAPYDYPENARVFVSTDAGASWREQGRVSDSYVTTLAVDPFAADRLYAMGRGNLLHRSTDNGSTWSSSSLPGQGTVLATDPLASGRLYIAGYYYDGSAYRTALYISTDNGGNWTVSLPQPDTTGYGYSVAADPVDAGTVYLGATSAQLYKSTDGGETWERRSDGLPTGTMVSGLSVNPDDNRIVLATTSSGFYRSTNGGERWTLAGSFSRAQGAMFSPADGQVAYGLAWTDAMRVCISTDAGATWTVPSPGYVVLKTASLHADPHDAQSAWLNTQAGVCRTTDTGSNWQDAHSGLRLTRVPAMAAGPDGSRRFYLSVNGVGVFRTTDAGDSWLRCADFPACDNISGIGVAYGTSVDALYALEGSG